jgi:hypothetical protein
MLLIAALSVVAVASASISVNQTSPTTYDVIVDDAVWLTSFDTFFTKDSKSFATGDGTLTPKAPSTSSGFDATGSFERTAFTFNEIPVEIFVRVYQNHLVFGQTFLEDFDNTSKGNDDVVRFIAFTKCPIALTLSWDSGLQQLSFVQPDHSSCYLYRHGHAGF